LVTEEGDRMIYVPLVLIGYILGSIPFAYLIARSHGVNILERGSKNPGAANVYRVVGHTAGALVFIGDVSKAALPVLLTRWLGAPEWVALLVGVAALLGHWYPIFLRFRGGAGVAPAIGIGLGMMPLQTTLALVVGGGGLIVFRSSGHATAIGAVAFLKGTFFMGKPVALSLAVAAQPLLVGVKRYIQVLLEARSRGYEEEM
jgi:glycerol-3-phosphate acyltransferase PlsY